MEERTFEILIKGNADGSVTQTISGRNDDVITALLRTTADVLIEHEKRGFLGGDMDDIIKEYAKLLKAAVYRRKAAEKKKSLD
jgi:hypothetical protein